MPEPSPGRRGTRPRNRRDLILAAAAELFAKHGYAKVGMGDLADAVGIAPSALYRHFTGKQDVLAKVLAAGLAPVHEVVLGLDLAEPSAAAAQLAGCALDQRHLGLMWQREARELTPEVYQPLRAVIHEIGQGLAGYVRSIRPGISDSAADLLAWSTLAVLTSPSFHHLDLPRPAYEELLAELVAAVIGTELSVPPVSVPPGPAEPVTASAGVAAGTLRPASRREELLIQAMRLFADRGYTQVGIEDIGSAVGISGPSVYNHWPAKLDLLITALRRGAAALAIEVAGVYRQATDAGDALHRLLRSYVELSHTQPEIFGLLITDIDHLPADERHASRRAQHEHVSEWAHLLRLDQPNLDPVAARIRAHAVLSVAHDTARTAHLHRDPAVPAAVIAICTRLLGLQNRHVAVSASAELMNNAIVDEQIAGR
jgi:AcrR family transcriptional regulator